VGALRLAGTLLDGTRRSAPAGASPDADARTPDSPPPSPGADPDGPGVAAGLARAGAAVGRAAAATITDPLGAARRSAHLGPSLWRYLQPRRPGARPS
jgi:hypothetical protein